MFICLAALVLKRCLHLWLAFSEITLRVWNKIRSLAQNFSVFGISNVKRLLYQIDGLRLQSFFRDICKYMHIFLILVHPVVKERKCSFLGWVLQMVANSEKEFREQSRFSNHSINSNSVN